MLPTLDSEVEWPLLSDEDWIQLKELCPFLNQFKELTLYFSATKECRMSDLCLDFEDLLVGIKVKYLDKKDQMSDKLWYAANSAYTKLTKLRFWNKTNYPPIFRRGELEQKSIHWIIGEQTRPDTLSWHQWQGIIWHFNQLLKMRKEIFQKGRRTIPYYRRSQNASTIRKQMLVNAGYILGVYLIEFTEKK